MIAKRIARKKGGDSFERLAGYVVNAKPSVDPANWTRLGAYILDEGNDGEKVAWARVSNCVSDDPGWAVKEIAATQARNTRSGSDKSYHLVLSFPEGERPTREQLEDIEDRVCAALGFAEHQRLSAVHQDTEHWHVHVAINKVHPRTFRNVEPWYDHYRLQEMCAELEIRHGLTRTNHTPARERRPRGGAADMEAYQGRDCFLRWVRDEAVPALLEAVQNGASWQELHQVAAGWDLAIKQRGAGLAIGHRSDPRLHVKASEVERGLSMKALESTLGPYEAPGEPARAEAAHTGYQPHTPPQDGDGKALYAAFQAQREAAVKAREGAMAALRQRHLDYARKLRDWYDTQYLTAREQRLPSSLRRQTYRHLTEKRRADQSERMKREAEERRHLRAAHAIPSWQGHLESLAGSGDETALRILRARQQRQWKMQAELLTAPDATAARNIVYAHLKPIVRRDGRMIYRVADGGVVMDEAQHVRVIQVTAGAAYLALSLATDRFDNRPLVVNGTEEFRQQVATLAAVEGLRVTFADSALERQRLITRARQRGAIDRGRNDIDRGR